MFINLVITNTVTFTVTVQDLRGELSVLEKKGKNQKNLGTNLVWPMLP